MKPIVLEFRREKETKGTFWYEEVEAAGRETAVGALREKDALGDQPPQRLRVTIEDGDTSN